MALQIAQMVFMAALLAALSVGIFVVGFILAHGLVLVVRNFKPDFGRPYQTPAAKHAETPANVKRVTLDFLMSERRRAEQELHNLQNPFMSADLSRLVVNRAIAKMSDENEFDLAAISALIKPRISDAQKELADKAEYGLIRYPEGPHGQPRYLCTKLSERGIGLRVAFAALADKSIRLDIVSAKRLASMMPNTFVVPMNAAARIATKQRENGGNNEAA